MNWRRGILRLWVALSLLWVVAATLLLRPDEDVAHYFAHHEAASEAAGKAAGMDEGSDEFALQVALVRANHEKIERLKN